METKIAFWLEFAPLKVRQWYIRQLGLVIPILELANLQAFAYRSTLWTSPWVGNPSWSQATRAHFGSNLARHRNRETFLYPRASYAPENCGCPREQWSVRPNSTDSSSEILYLILGHLSARVLSALRTSEVKSLDLTASVNDADGLNIAGRDVFPGEQCDKSHQLSDFDAHIQFSRSPTAFYFSPSLFSAELPSRISTSFTSTIYPD